VIAKVALLNADHMQDGRHFGLAIPQIAQPVDVKVFLPAGRKVVLNSTRGHFRL